MCVWCVSLQASTDIQLKKLEEQLSDACSRGDDLQRALTEVNVARNRLTGIGPDHTMTSFHTVQASTGHHSIASVAGKGGVRG